MLECRARNRKVVVKNTVFNSGFCRWKPNVFYFFPISRARQQQFSLVGEGMTGMTYLALPNRKMVVSTTELGRHTLDQPAYTAYSIQDRTGLVYVNLGGCLMLGCLTPDMVTCFGVKYRAWRFFFKEWGGIDGEKRNTKRVATQQPHTFHARMPGEK